MMTGHNILGTSGLALLDMVRAEPKSALLLLPFNPMRFVQEMSQHLFAYGGQVIGHRLKKFYFQIDPKFQLNKAKSGIKIITVTVFLKKQSMKNKVFIKFFEIYNMRSICLNKVVSGFHLQKKKRRKSGWVGLSRKKLL